MSEYYDGGDHAGHDAGYEGHDAYQGEEHGAQYADYQEQVHHAIEVIGEKIDGIEHDIQAYQEPAADHDASHDAGHDAAQDDDGHAYASDEYQADEHKAEGYQADDYKGDDYKADQHQGYSPYARS